MFAAVIIKVVISPQLALKNKNKTELRCWDVTTAPHSPTLAD